MGIKDKFSEAAERIKSKGRGSGWNDDKSGGRHVTPWAWRTPESVYAGWAGDVWLYRSLELHPWTWADPKDRIRFGSKISDTLADVTGVSAKGILPESFVKSNREFHLVSLTWETPARPPEENSHELSEYQHAAFSGMSVPKRTLLLGIRLQPKGSSVEKKNKTGAMASGMRDISLRVLGEDTPDMDAYAADIKNLDAILRRSGAKLPTREEQYYLESWYNLGRGPEAQVIEEWDRLRIDNFDEIQLAAVSDFHRPVLQAPLDTWLLDALNHPAGPHVVSLRGRLMPPQQARARSRRAIRWAYDQIDEEAKSGDVERREIDDVHSMAKTLDDHYADTRYPMLVDLSVIFARRTVGDVPETYVEDLRARYDIEVVPLMGRQLAALDETLPCSTKRVNPYPQDLSTDMVGFAGLSGWSGLGDSQGALMGVTVEDLSPVFLDPSGAPKANQPASMAVFGDSGSGKAQPLNAKILTPTGWTTMGSIQPGDTLTGADGSPCSVTGVFPQGMKPAYRVEFNDGSSTITCDEHLWAVKNFKDRHNNNPYIVKELKDLAKELTQKSSTAFQWYIPIIEAVQHPTVAILVTPYSDGVTFVQKEKPTNSYIQASIEQRVEFLQGVFDTAGVVQTDIPDRIQIMFNTSASVDFLTSIVRSLGGLVYATDKKAPFDLNVALPSTIVPFRSSENVDIYVPHVDNVPCRYISKINYIDEMPMQCISVDTADHLYVTDDYIVTHNTVFLQNLATQAVLDGMPVVFINPKALDDLSPLADLVGGQVLSMSRIEDAGGGGYFDPFRFTDPEIAADIAATFILSVLTELTERQQLLLRDGLRRGALQHGARCVGEALQYVEDDDVIQDVALAARSEPRIGLGISWEPLEKFSLGSSLTLIEFDRDLDLPEPGAQAVRMSQRASLAAMQHVVRVSLEMMAAKTGGVLIIDEAWIFLEQAESRAALDGLGRKGRSLNVLPVLATQKVADLLKYDMESLLSRVVCLSMRDSREAAAALTLAGLEPTADRIEFLSDCGPRRNADGTTRVPLAIHRDLENRRGVIAMGPIPSKAMAAFSTNPEDRKKRAAEMPKPTGDSSPEPASNTATPTSNAVVVNKAAQPESLPPLQETESVISDTPHERSTVGLRQNQNPESVPAMDLVTSKVDTPDETILPALEDENATIETVQPETIEPSQAAQTGGWVDVPQRRTRKPNQRSE